MEDNPFGIPSWQWEKIRNLRLLDNLLMQTALDGFIPGVELILRIILNMPELVITELAVQKIIPNLVSRDLILDVKAVDSNGRYYNMEVQCSDSGAIPRRPRYHSALMDVEFLRKGHKLEELPVTYVVFITQNDVLGAGLPVYHISRVVEETGLPFRDEAHIVYANGSYHGEDEIGRLMSDFRANDPDDMHYALLAEQVRSVKYNRKGVGEMSRVLELTYQEGIEQGVEKARLETLSFLMSRNSWTLDQAMDFTGYPVDQKARYAQLIGTFRSDNRAM